jgi:hypothetical protein
MPRLQSFDIGLAHLRKGGRGHVFNGPDREDRYHHSFQPSTLTLLGLIIIILTNDDDDDEGTQPDLVPKAKEDTDRGCVCPGVCDKGIPCSKPDGHSNYIG